MADTVQQDEAEAAQLAQVASGYLPAVSYASGSAPVASSGSGQFNYTYLPPRAVQPYSFGGGGGGGGGGSSNQPAYATPDATGWGNPGTNGAPASSPGQDSSGGQTLSYSGDGTLNPDVPLSGSSAPSDYNPQPIADGWATSTADPNAPTYNQGLTAPSTFNGQGLSQTPYTQDAQNLADSQNFAMPDGTITGSNPPGPDGSGVAASVPPIQGLSAGPAGSLSEGWDADLYAPGFPAPAMSAGPTGVLPVGSSLNDLASANPGMLMTQLDSIYGGYGQDESPAGTNLNNLIAQNPNMTMEQINQLNDQQLGPIAAMPGTAGAGGEMSDGQPGQEGTDGFIPTDGPMYMANVMGGAAQPDESLVGTPFGESGWGGNSVFDTDFGVYGQGTYAPEQFGPAGGQEAGVTEGLMSGGPANVFNGPYTAGGQETGDIASSFLGGGGDAGSAGEAGGGDAGNDGGGDGGGD